MNRPLHAGTVVLAAMLIAASIVSAGFEFDPTCMTSPEQKAISPSISLQCVAYRIEPTAELDGVPRGQALLERLKLLVAEGKASCVGGRTVTASQGSVVDVFGLRHQKPDNEGASTLSAILIPMVLADGSIHLALRTSVTNSPEGALVLEPGERYPDDWNLPKLPAGLTPKDIKRLVVKSPHRDVSATTTNGVPVAMPMAIETSPPETDDDAGVPGMDRLVLVVTPTVVGDVSAGVQPRTLPKPDAGSTQVTVAAAGVPQNGRRVQVSTRLVDVNDVDGIGAVLAAEDLDLEALLNQLRNTSEVTFINEPRITIASGAEGTVSFYTHDVADPVRHIESRLTIAPDVLADGRIELSCQRTIVDMGVRLHQTGRPPRMAPSHSTITFEATVPDGETVLLDLGLDRMTDGRRALLLITPRIVE